MSQPLVLSRSQVAVVPVVTYVDRHRGRRGPAGGCSRAAADRAPVPGETRSRSHDGPQALTRSRDRPIVRRIPAVIVLALATLSIGAPSPARATDRAPVSPTPLLAYYYIWFTPSSWSRGKRDYPLLGRYSSDDTGIMRQHVRWAKSAGIDGFLVSWKSTPTLDDRLARLIRVANAQHFRLGIVYEGLDFHRRPLPIATVRHDLERFAATFAHNRAFAIFERPVVVWSGTWRYTNAQIRIRNPARARRAARAGVGQEHPGLRARRTARRRRRVLLVVREPAPLPGYGRKLRGLGALSTPAAGSGSPLPRLASMRG